MNSLAIKPAGKKGRGVFADKDFKEGDIIETCPVIFLSGNDDELLSQTKLFNYVFSWEVDGCVGSAVALGLGSLFNHSYNPNAVYIKHMDKGLIEFRVLKDIKQGEEIVTNYNGDPNSKDLIWFEVLE